MKGYLLKAPEGQMARWKDAARESGLSFAEFCREALNEKCSRQFPGKVTQDPAKVSISRDPIQLVPIPSKRTVRPDPK